MLPRHEPDHGPPPAWVAWVFRLLIAALAVAVAALALYTVAVA